MQRVSLLCVAVALCSVWSLAVAVQPARAAGLASFTALTPTPVGGNYASVSIRLDAPAPPGGQPVSLLSSDTSLVTVPASATVLEGLTVTYTAFRTHGVAATSTVTVTAAAGGVTKRVALWLKPANLMAVSAPPPIGGGGAGAGTVTLDGAAPPRGLTVALSSANAAASVPETVTVPANANKVAFTITTLIVVDTTKVKISASYGGVTRNAVVTVAPLAVSSLVFYPASIAAGATATGALTLNGPAPAGGAVVSLGVEPTAPLTVPSSVTVSAGSKTVTFVVTGQDVAAATRVPVSATLGGETRSTTITVVPPGAKPIALTVHPDPGHAGYGALGTVHLARPAPTNLMVLLRSGSLSVTVPVFVIVQAGADHADFVITTRADASGSVRLTATAGADTVTYDWWVQQP